jgi:Flp pilus assembly protein TadD
MQTDQITGAAFAPGLLKAGVRSAGDYKGAWLDRLCSSSCSAASIARKSSPVNEGHLSVPALFENAVARQNAGQLAEAIAIYNRIILLEPNLPGVHSNLGNIFNALGRFSEAEKAFRKAVLLKPDFAVAYSNLGNALKDQGRPQEAETAHRHAIALNPGLPEAHSNLAVTLVALGKFEEAEKAYHQAIRLKPDLASAYSNLGLLLAEFGRFAEARHAADQAVRLAPRDAHYLRNLSWLRQFETGDPYLLQMEKLAEDAASLSVDSQIELRFAMAKAYEDIGEGDRAFHQLLDANLLKRRHVAYDESETLGNMRRVEEVFTPELIRKWQGVGEPTSVPVFIVGMLRSGSTLVEQILASHPLVFGGGELKLFGKALASISADQGRTFAFPHVASSMSGEQFRSLGARYLAELKQLAPGAARITDKMPANFLYAGLIHLALPNAIIIHTVRDPIDTCVSCFSKLFDEPQLHTYDLAELGRYYRSYNALMVHWRSVLPSHRILDVHYEEVIDDLEGVARRIVSHCGLSWDPRCLDFYRTERPVRTTSALQVRRPIYKSSVGRGRPYEAFLTPLLRELFGGY